MTQRSKTNSLGILLFFLLTLLLLPWAYCAPQKLTTPPEHQALKSIIPLEQLIRQTRKQYGDIVIQSTRLTGPDKERTYLIDFTDINHLWQRATYNAHTGKLLGKNSLQLPMPIEDSLVFLHKKHPDSRLIRTWLDSQEGHLMRIAELSDAKKKRWKVIQDAYTGLIVSEQSYSLTPKGQVISLAQILTDAKNKHKGMVVLRTRSTLKDKTKVKEITYLDASRTRRKMVVNSATGEVMSDTIISALAI